MVAMQNIPITEHERRFVAFAQVLCVGRSVANLLSAIPRRCPGGTPCGIGKAGKINIDGNAAIIRKSERSKPAADGPPFPTEFRDVVCINENGRKTGNFAGRETRPLPGFGNVV